MAGPKVSIIVPTLNEEKRIADCLGHLKSIAPDAELIVSDGVSADHTVEIAKAAGARVVRETNDPSKRTTIGAGRNAGAHRAKGEIVWFVDADTKPGKRFYSRMLKEFEDFRVVGVGCKIMPRSVGIMDDALFEFLNLLVFFSVLFKRPSIAGPCVAYRKAAFNAVKGFDEEMQASEDQDLCVRISKIGRVVYLKDVTATTSSRRLKKMGWLGLLFDWGKTTLYFLFGKKNKRYVIVREV